MNILPKKRWHVRTKENIARVRKDEAEAAEKAREEEARIETANREARLTFLKNSSKQRLTAFEIDSEYAKQEIQPPLEHVNLFEDLHHAVTTTNKEHDKEVKEKKEEYEKKIGYLTYLGQDTNEAQGKKNWYEVHPQSSRLPENIKDTYDKLIIKDEDGKPKKRELDEKDGEIDWKRKQRHDPINAFKEYCERKQITHQETVRIYHSNSRVPMNKERKDSEKNCKHNKDKDNKLQKLREARLRREEKEKQKTEMFLTNLNGGPVSSEKITVNKITPKYNTQFNPELARQNYW